MKTVLLSSITIYKNIISPLLHAVLGQKNMCRYETSCSTYAQEVISKHGALKGSKMAALRFLSCQPFTKPYAHI